MPEAKVFTAIVREEGMVRKVVLELQPDGSYEVVQGPATGAGESREACSVGQPAFIPGEYL